MVDKPSGVTSHDVVATVRRTLGQPKVGHLGTLDPLATGVLPLVIGRATRLAPWFSDATKQYAAVIRLGLTTDTCDITGTVVPHRSAPDETIVLATSHAIRDAASTFVGTYEQLPPQVSAKKIGGVRAYDLARRKQTVTLKPVKVTVEDLSILAVEGPRIHCRVTSSSGFYVRALARDLGEAVGCGGCLEMLRREQHGPFALAQAMPLDELLAETRERAVARIIPIDRLLPEMPVLVATDRGAERIAHGNPLRAPEFILTREHRSTDAGSTSWRVLDREGHLLAIAEHRHDVVQPKVVLVPRTPVA